MRAHGLRNLWTKLRESGLRMGMLYLVYYCSLGAWSPFLNIYLRQIGQTGLQIGLLGSTRPLLMLFTQPLWGLAADLWGRRRTLLLAASAAALLVLGFVLGRGFGFFFAWNLLFAVFLNPIIPLNDSLTLDYLEDKPHLSYGKIRWWGAAGWGLMALIMGRLLMGRDLRLIFVAGSALLAVYCLLVWRSGRRERAGVTLRRGWNGVGILLRNRQLLVFLALIALLQIGVSSIYTFYGIYMTEMGASSQLIGLAYTFQGISETPMYLLAGTIITRLGSHRVLPAVCALYALRVFLYAAIRNPMGALFVELMHGLTFSLYLTSSIDYVNTRIPNEWRATGQSLFWAAGSGAGSIIGSAWGGLLYDQLGVRGMFRWNGVLMAVVAIAAAILLRGRRQSYQASTDANTRKVA
jgi:PPP family 3-phenylpropionic acid transporter